MLLEIDMRTYSITCERDKLCWLAAIGLIQSVEESDNSLSKKVKITFSSYFSEEEIAHSIGDLTIEGKRYNLT
jgi:hypothetical protein